MTLSASVKTKLNRMNRAAQDASLGTLLGQLEGGEAGILKKISQRVIFSEFTDGGGASGTLVMDEGIPVGATVLYSSVTGIVGFTGNVSATVTIGDGTDPDRYNTGTPSVFATADGVSVGAPSGVAFHAAAKDVTLTVAGSSDFGAISAGAMTVSIYYLL